MANPTIPTDATPPTVPVVAPAVPYEQRMAANWEWGMNESSLFFEGKGKVQETLRRISQRLNSLSIPYAVAGGMALFHHGYRRYTEDVDILVTREGLKEIHERLDGLGFVRPFSQSKNLRDAETGVKIEFLLAGDFPGDGRPKEVAFPDPALVAEESNNVRFLDLPTFITLKLTSGMTGVNRDKDLVDVLELVKATSIGLELAERLPASVQAKYREICSRAKQGAVQYVFLNQSVPDSQLEAMLHDGVFRASDGRLVTTDPAVAKKYDMWPEDEVFNG